MIVYIMHNDRIYIYKLPKTVEGKYLIYDYDSNGNHRNLVNIEAKDNSWIMYDNENVKIIYNNNEVKQSKLQIYNFYQLKVFETEHLILFTFPAYDNTFIRKAIKNNSRLICGKGSDADIIYTYAGISDKQIELTFENGVYSFKNLDLRVPVYVNNVRKDAGELSCFDTIFIMGLKIIVCNGYILINNPVKLLHLLTNQFNELHDELIVGNLITSTKSFKDFYEEKDYFYISPTFQNRNLMKKLVIASPPSKPGTSNGSLLMEIVPSALMSLTSVFTLYTSWISYRKGESTKTDLMSSLIMAAIMLISAVLWPMVERLYMKFQTFKTIRKQNKVYKKYLAEKEKELKNIISEEQMVLKSNYISIQECQQHIINKSSELFNRSYESEDFLRVRLGISDLKTLCEIEYPVSEYTIEKDPMDERAKKMISENQVLKDVPFTISLKNINIFTFILNEQIFDSYLNSIMLQILSLHDYYDLKIVLLTSSAGSRLNKYKEVSHCWNDERNYRYYASNLEEGRSISSELMKIFQTRGGDKIVDTTYYLIISDCINVYRDMDIIQNTISSGKSRLFGLLMFDTSTRNIPKGCKNFAEINSKEGTEFQTNMTDSSLQRFKIEQIDYKEVNFDKCISLLANIPMKSNKIIAGLLPTNLGFLEMYNVGNINQLNVDIRWRESNLINSLAAPIGVDANGNLLYLDLHEKFHGPHGLVAGMTGSGKSEFIVTYILSLAINYRPDEVQFVLIDYKGGGLAGAFENRKTGIKLPHLVGTITNLDKSEMNRTLVSIKSELQRRQRVFNEAKENLDTGNIDIYKYQKLHREGQIKEPLSHLFIICDEFAELKQQQPDFMDELVSAARIGRSLGIHLILATQKPSGVVDDQIWSNSKFKVCCKVQTADDSNEMIRRPDAASIKESGRFYLQVGYDAYFVMGQSAYSGLPYAPSDAAQTKVDNSITFLNDNGEEYKSVTKKDETVTKKVKEDIGEELINIVKYLIEVAKKENFPNQQLWLDNVPKELYYQNVVLKYSIKPTVCNINPIIGEYDSPANQSQGYLSLDLNERGNTFIAGISGSGKTTMLSTMLYSIITTHNSDEVNAYILDFGAEKLKMFEKAPQIGEVLTIGDKNKINYLFYKIQNEIARRKKYFSNNGGSFESCIKNGKVPFPTLLVIINDNDIFKENYSDIYDDRFPSIVRDCNKVGIIFIVTANQANSIGYAMESYFPQKIGLKFTDPTDYLMLFESGKMVPSDNPGRGLCSLDGGVYEFQTAMTFPENEYEKNMNYVFEQLSKCLKSKAPLVPTIPDMVTMQNVSLDDITLESIPVGINMKTAQMETFNFARQYNFIYSRDYATFAKFVYNLTQMISSIKNNKIIVLNGTEIDFNFAENTKYYNSGFAKIIPVLYQNIKKYNESSSKDDIFNIVIISYSKIQNHMLQLKEKDPKIVTLDELLLSSKNNNFKFNIFDVQSFYPIIKQSKFYENTDHDIGLWLGPGFQEQSVFEIDEFLEAKENRKTGVLVGGDKIEIIKFIQ